MSTPGVGYGVIGAGWMGDVHSRAISRLTHHFPDLGPAPVLHAVAEPLTDVRNAFVSKHGAVTEYDTWQELIDDPRIQLVSITTPNATHREIAVAAARAGKNIWIEKPVGLSSDDVQEIARAVKAAGVQCHVGFNYRHIPAVTACQRIVTDGEIGQVTHARVWLLTDYAAHPGGPLSWRFTLERGGHGVLGDLLSHAFDLSHFLLHENAGDIDTLVAMTTTFISERPVTPPGGSHYAIIEDATEFGPVENEDFVAALARTTQGVPLILESSRADVGEENNYGFEIHGTHGLVSWDYRRSDEYRWSTGHSFQHQEVRTHFAGPGDGAYTRFYPGAGNAMSYDDTKVCEAADVVRSLRDGTHHGAGLADALYAARALDAVVNSAATRSWVSLSHDAPMQ